MGKNLGAMYPGLMGGLNQRAQGEQKVIELVFSSQIRKGLQ